MKQSMVLPWSRVSQRWGHPWHSMCSYLACFPPALARSLIYLFSGEEDTVFDPFSGRGTTLLECRLTGRVPIASDLNPIAFALTDAKNTDVTFNEVINRINELAEGFDLNLYLPEAKVQPDDIQLIYHPYTLAKLCYLRRYLVPPTSDVDRFLVGVVLGIMHGKERQDGTSLYASISMPNTFSMSPEYVRRFVQTKQLKRVERDVFSLLKEKTNLLFRQGVNFKTAGRVVLADAKKMLTIPEFQNYIGGVDLILTSPPYLNVVNYALQNWIRMWFLKEDVRKIHNQLDDNLSINESLDFLVYTTSQMSLMLSDKGVAVIVIGDVARGKNSYVSLARDLIRRLYEQGTFEYIGCFSDRLNVQEKTTRIWNETRGRATTIERILVLAKRPPIIRTDQLYNIEAEVFGLQVRKNFVEQAEKVIVAQHLNVEQLADNAHSFAGL